MSNLIIRSVQIVDPGHEFDGRQCDVLIENGLITRIESHLELKADTEVNASGAVMTTGWVDVLSHCGEPGEEWKEDVNSLARAAQAGGFTHIASFCGQHPLPDHAGAITALINKAAGLPVHLLPLGCITAGASGVDMAELYDMASAGAAGFTDADKPLNDQGLWTRVLEYSRDLGKPVYHFPYDKSLAPGGRMHEGAVSTSLGLKGIPSISESNPLQQFLNIAGWLGAPARVVRVSSAAGVEALRTARAAGVDVKAAVPVYNLLFTDNDLAQFDENHKVLPPYRTEKDRAALWQALTDGTIDAVMSNHQPQDTESKAVEFEYAAWGASAVQTVLNAMLMAGKPDVRLIATALSSGPRRFLGLKQVSIAVGQPADLTIFSTTGEWTFTSAANFSKGVNHPLLNQTLKGKVLGTVVSGQWHQNPAFNTQTA